MRIILLNKFTCITLFISHNWYTLIHLIQLLLSISRYCRFSVVILKNTILGLGFAHFWHLFIFMLCFCTCRSPLLFFNQVVGADRKPTIWHTNKSHNFHFSPVSHGPVSSNLDNSTFISSPWSVFFHRGFHRLFWHFHYFCFDDLKMVLIKVPTPTQLLRWWSLSSFPVSSFTSSVFSF